jgi:hypothetical protein
MKKPFPFLVLAWALAITPSVATGADEARPPKTQPATKPAPQGCMPGGGCCGGAAACPNAQPHEDGKPGGCSCQRNKQTGGTETPPPPR